MKWVSIVAVLAVLTVARPAAAWHEAGHMQTALIAYDQLDKPTRDRLVQILRAHPRFQEDFASSMGSDVTDEVRPRWIVAQASIWPDIARRGSGPSKIPALPKELGSWNRPNWHFINLPLVLTPAGAPATDAAEILKAAKQHLNLSEDPPAEERLDMNALQAIAFNAKVVKTAPDDATKAVAVCWLLHLIGDIHQPEHAVALYTQRLFAPAHFPEGDRGGNLLAFGDPHATHNLHFLWDDGPGDQGGFAAAAARVAALTSEPELQKLGQQALAAKAPADWARESFDLADKHVYTAALREQILNSEVKSTDPVKDKAIDPPTAAYAASVKTVATERVVQGGFRLGAFLKDVLAP